jgi:transcriptional regulator with XRE-family HTH domain
MGKRRSGEEGKIRIGARLKKLREEKGETLTSVAKYLGVSKKSMSCYENDISRTPIEILEKLSKYYKADIDYIITGKRVEYKEIEVRDKNLLKNFERIDKLDNDVKKALNVILDRVILGSEVGNR